MTNNNINSSLVFCSTGRCTEFFASRHVSLLFHEFSYPTEPRTDVYSYNFPDDRRFVKLLGRHRRLISPFNKLIKLSNSVFRLSSRDRSNGSDWCRCLQSVHDRIRRSQQFHEAWIFSDRSLDHGWVHFAHRSSILLVSYLDVEQTSMVALPSHFRRMSDPSHFLQILILLIQKLSVTQAIGALLDGLNVGITTLVAIWDLTYASDQGRNHHEANSIRMHFWLCWMLRLAYS